MIPARTSRSQTRHNKAFAGSDGLFPKRQFNRFVTLDSTGAAARGSDFSEPVIWLPHPVLEGCNIPVDGALIRAGISPNLVSDSASTAVGLAFNIPVQQWTEGGIR
jgi:hypothetical protein